jgi:glyoxylase-like metal-dependent hydrolase (beta-lactamase superfamily II)
MANRAPHDAATRWWVDHNCIDCGASQNLAPDFICERGGISVFERQPGNRDEETAAWRALLACPTASVHAPEGRKPPANLFPQALADNVWRLGFNARSSFGAMAYFAETAGQRFMIDAPRWSGQLSKWIGGRGGLDHILLTHRDDVADADRYAAAFDATVWIHEADASAAPYADRIIEGTSLQAPLSGLRILPVPGHTRGSVVFLIDDTFLFSGDSLSWSFEEDGLVARREVCWYDWDSQLHSLAEVAEKLEFSWVLPGHGGHVHAPAADLRAGLGRMLAGFGQRAAR